MVSITAMSHSTQTVKESLEELADLVLTGVFWEGNSQRGFLYLYLKQVLLVEEEDDGGIAKPFVVTYRVKQLKTLLHSVL